MTFVQKKADFIRGKSLYKKKEQTCSLFSLYFCDIVSVKECLTTSADECILLFHIAYLNKVFCNLNGIEGCSFLYLVA